MTALHLLCLNPNATPEMFDLLANAYPQAATMQAEMITDVKYEYDDDAVRQVVVEEISEIVTSTKLCLKTKRIP